MSSNKITFNCNLSLDDHIDVFAYESQGPVLVAFESGNSTQVSLTPANAFAMGMHLIEISKKHMNLHEVASYLEAMAKEAKARIPPAPVKEKPQGYTTLTPLAQTIYQHMRRAGSISAREAMNDYGIMTGSLVRRLTDMEEAGFTINRERKVHPVTGRRYTRYSLAA